MSTGSGPTPAPGITADEVRRVWDGRIEPVSGEFLPTVLSPATREFLTTVGLPTVPTLSGTFIRDGRLSTTVSLAGQEYLVCTEDEPGDAFAIELISGQVFRVQPPNPAFTCFYNSDIARFLYFYGILHREVLSFIQDGVLLSEAQFESILGTLTDIEAELHARDAAAIDGETAWYGELLSLREDVGATLHEMELGIARRPEGPA